MKPKRTIDNTEEREAVGRCLQLCELLQLKPEDLGLRKTGPEGHYAITHQTVKILEQTTATLGVRA